MLKIYYWVLDQVREDTIQQTRKAACQAGAHLGCDRQGKDCYLLESLWDSELVEDANTMPMRRCNLSCK